jgi:hypothetical protein
MMAISAAGKPSGNRAYLQMLRSQDATGGWGFAGPGDPDTNSTAVAMQALVASVSDFRSTSLETLTFLRAASYLHDQQGSDGGFSYQRTSDACTGECPSDPNSTAYVIQGLLAAGQDVDDPVWRKGEKGPIEALMSMQGPDGSFRGFSPLIATTQAVPGLLGMSFTCIAAAIAC